MTDHGEQPGDQRRAPATTGAIGRSFADAWGTDSPAAELSTAPFDEAGLAPATEAGPEMTPMGDVHATTSFASARQATSVTVSRPLRTDLSAPAQSGTDDRLTVEIRRQGGSLEPSRPPETIVVTVSLNGVDEQVAVSF